MSTVRFRGSNPLLSVNFLKMDRRIFLKYGFHVGGKAPLWRPVSNNYLGNYLSKVFVFDLNRTRSVLSKALIFVKHNWVLGNSFVFVEKSNISSVFNTLVFYNSYMEDRFFFLNRWYGGFFTNFFNLFPRFILKVRRLGMLMALEKKLSFKLLKDFPKYCSHR